jgi:aminoglycoside phosphotransferase (APT) family kinase protein
VRSSAVVSEAIQRFGLAVDRQEPVPESFSSGVTILTLEGGERLVLKIPFSRRKLLREQRALGELQGVLPVPRVLDHWLADDGQGGALLLSLLPGQVVSGAVTVDLAFGMGQLLAQLHRHPVAEYGDGLDSEEGSASEWWSLLDQTFRQWQPLCEGVLPAEIYRETLVLYEALYNHLPEPDGPCWTHFDYRPGNILVQGTEITGLIDFESSRGGSADLDFCKIKNQVWDPFPGTREAFLRGYALVRPVPALEHSLPFYELHVAFGGIAWCVRRTSVRDPFFGENLEWLTRILASTSGRDALRQSR